MRRLLPLLSTYFVDTFGLAIVYPLLTPLFLNENYGLLSPERTPAQRLVLLSLLIASFPLAQLFGAPLIGALSDRIGRRRVFLITISGGIFGYLLTAIGIQAGLLTLLWIGRILTGLFAANLSLCLAAIADMSRNSTMRARHFGWIGAVGGPGFIIAIFTGGALINYPSLAFFLTAALAMINLLIVIRLFRETHPSHPAQPFNVLLGLHNISTAMKFKGVRPIYLSYFFFTMCWVTSMQLLPSYITLRLSGTAFQVSLALICVALFWLIANSLVNPWLAKRLPSPAVFSVALSLLTLLLFLTLAMKNFALFLPFFSLAALFSALSWTNGLATISLTAPPSIQGSILGINQSISALASIIGPIIGGALVSFGTGFLLIFTGICSLIAVFLLRTRPKTRIT